MPKAHYTFITPDLEDAHCHFKLSLGVLHKYLLFGTTLSCLIGLLFAQRPVLAGIENYEWENGGVWNTTFIEARKARGFTGRITLKETVESLDPSHPLYELEKRSLNWISYSFGSNIHNYCQMFLSVVSANYILNILDHHRLVRIGRFLLPFLDAMWMTFAMLILCLQKDQDKLMRSWMYWHLPLFAVSFAAYAILYVVFTAAVFQQSWKTIIQFFCVCVFCTSMPHVCHSYLEMLKDGGKPCYFDVPLFIGLAEYAAVASVYIFVCTQFQELNCIEGMISLCKMEYDDYFYHTESYSPAFWTDEASSTQASIVSCSPSTAS